MKQLLFTICLVTAHTGMAAESQIAPAIIPQPARMELRDGTSRVTAGMPVFFETDSADACSAATFLAAALEKITGKASTVQGLDGSVPARVGSVRVKPDDKLGAEGYRLSVKPDGVVIAAGGGAGMFYGVQTFLQLLPVSAQPVQTISVRALEIDDAPRFAWRGFMLDEARHFFGKATVLKLLDTMAYLKLNRLQWHLTDDRWRFEINAYPKLTTVGAVGTLSKPEGPAAFYTQDDIREIVAYAAARHIVIIPEIEMPGHARGATVAYPELAGGDDTDKNWKYFTFNPASPKVREFLDKVLDETVRLFPGPYLCIGGDETHFGNKAWANRPEVKALMQQENLPNLAAVEHRFMQQMAESVVRRGKKVMGWQEVIHTGLPANQVVPIWWHDDDFKGLSDMLTKKYPVVLCPHDPCYFSRTQDPTHRSGRIPHPATGCSLEAVYAFPDTLRAKVPDMDHIHGIQAALWTEVIHTPQRLWFMTFPRLAALAESAWTPVARKDIGNFKKRLPSFFDYLNHHGINYFNPLNPGSTPEIYGPSQIYIPEWDGWQKKATPPIGKSSGVTPNTQQAGSTRK